MQTGFKKDYPSNVARSGSILTSGRVGRVPRFEYVNRQGQVVNPKTGKPYDRKHENGVHHQSSGKSAAKALNKRYPIKTRGTMFGGLEPIPTDPTRDPPPRVCYNCWQKGHSRRDCPRPAVARYCNNCGRRGEDLRTCPRCKLAHDRYLIQLQAKERGEELDPEEVERLLPESEFYEDEIEQDEDGCDEILRELMLQDERARIVSNGLNRDYQERRIGLAVFQEREDAFPFKNREREMEIEREEDALKNLYAERGRQERRSGYSDRETRYDNEIDQQYEMERRERNEREERERERSRWRVQEVMSNAATAKQSTSSTTVSEAQITSDPVQDFLLLAKTIAHLSPETQDLIMRQVIAERKEHQARWKGMQQEHEEDTWP
ncbi:hypothetical protein TSAR_005007 [Trichomalopsis sarcophagae]|uniref:CCHC-type domain-containing protein n=1 Tax=Trichomalopsis sarcophagae TaxID=543379 RepID=A0A232EZM4_9HYME|nr:hypothetical protein TSAR_005007 [Trichomalopsis sarcophagae]